MKSQIRVYIPIVMAVMLTAGILIGSRINPVKTEYKYDNLHKLKEVLSHINSSYVDTVNTGELMETLIQELMFDLDPHSVYIAAEELKRLNESLSGDFDGIGIEFNILNDTIIVVSPIPGGPSESLGILAGDKIVKIEGENVAGTGITNADVIGKLRGKKGSKVNISIFRKSETELLEFTITRDKIPIFSVDAHYMINKKTGYVKINRFSDKTVDEFKEAAENLKDQGMINLVLDLRGNPGGYLNSAWELTDQFFGNKKLLVYTEGRSRKRVEYNSTNDGYFINGNLIVLINEGSASASEIVSGAIQDYDRGLIIGRRSFGKGLVQEQIMLSDGSAIRLTVAKYYTPSGRCIQKPYSNGDHGEYYHDLMNRYNNGEMINKDSIEFPDSLKYKTESDRVVYGGGGIMPDIFIPIDTARSYAYFNKISRQGLIYRFVLTYVDENRKELKSQYTDFESFEKNFVISDNFYGKFIAFVEDNNITGDVIEVRDSKDILSAQIKAYVARQFFGSNGYYKIINNLDNEYVTAVKIFNSGEFKNFGVKYTEK